MMNDFERLMATIMSEGLARIEELSDEELERVIDCE